MKKTWPRVICIILLLPFILPVTTSTYGQTPGRPIERVSVTSTGAQSIYGGDLPSFSADGRLVAFRSHALTNDDNNNYADIYIKDRVSGAVERLQVPSSGIPANSYLNKPTLSADGRLVLFDSPASNLATCDTSPVSTAFLHDRQTGETTCVATGMGGEPPNGYVINPVMTPDGRYIAFESYASNLVPGDTNGYEDVFILDRATGALTCASATPAGVTSYRGAMRPDISDDGRYVVYDANESKLLPGYNSKNQIYLYDLQSGLNTRISVGVDGLAGNMGSGSAAISADGRWIAFETRATNLGLNNSSVYQVVVYDRQAGEFFLASQSSEGVMGNLESRDPRISPDGRYVSFVSKATNLVPGDTNGYADIFLHDFQTGTTTRLSVAADGTQANYASNPPAVFSNDASLIAFASGADNLVVNDTNEDFDVFVVGAEPFPAGTVQVIQDGSVVNEAQVYRNGVLAGVTDSSGRLVIPGLALGDQLVARRLVYTQPAVKSNHSDWAYRVYITSLDIPTNDEPAPFIVTELLTPTILTLRKSNTLIGFNILAAVEWDANSSYLNDLLVGFRNASNYLYDASDGQMLFEQVTVTDNNQFMSDADFQFRASNQEWPTAHLLGLRKGGLFHIFFGRYFDGKSSNQGIWSAKSAFRTFIHEFSHYAFGLYDSYEYYDGLVKKDAYCTSIGVVYLQGDATNATLMYYAKNATEFSARGVPSLWSEECEKTVQFQIHGESDWETILNEFADSQSSPRWELKSALDHGSVVSGPNNNPVPGWTHADIAYDAASGVCDLQPRYHFTQDDQPAPNVSVVLQKSGRLIYQGKTDLSGNITILGASAGDRIYGAWWKGSPHHSSTLVTCPNALEMRSTLFDPTTEIVLTSDPYSLTVATSPGTLPDQLSVTIQASVPLSSTPVATLMQSGADDSVIVPLTLNSTTGEFTGQISLAAGYPSAGSILVQAVDTGNRQVMTTQTFQIETVSMTQDWTVTSSDGQAELYLPAGTLPSDSRLAIFSDQLPAPLPEKQILLSGPYTISLEEGVPFLRDASLSIHYVDLSDTLMYANLAGSQIYHWVSGTWQPISSSSNQVAHDVSAPISTSGTFVVLAERQKLTFLPLVANRTSLVKE